MRLKGSTHPNNLRRGTTDTDLISQTISTCRQVKENFKDLYLISTISNLTKLYRRTKIPIGIGEFCDKLIIRFSTGTLPLKVYLDLTGGIAHTIIIIGFATSSLDAIYLTRCLSVERSCYQEQEQASDVSHFFHSMFY